MDEVVAFRCDGSRIGGGDPDPDVGIVSRRVTANRREEKPDMEKGENGGLHDDGIVGQGDVIVQHHLYEHQSIKPNKRRLSSSNPQSKIRPTFPNNRRLTPHRLPIHFPTPIPQNLMRI